MDEVRTSDESPNLRSGKLKIIKNLVVISMSILLLFTAYDGLSMLQSTMNKEEGIGTVSQAVLYAGFCISSLLLPKYVIKKVGCKVGLIMSTTFFIPYIAANFYPNWITMMPSAALLGIGASLLWGSQCTYFNESALMFCTLTEVEEEQKQGVQKPKTSLVPKSKRVSVEVLSIRHTSVDELSYSKTQSTSLGNLSIRSSPEVGQFKSTEVLTSNEIIQGYGKYYENFDGADSNPNKEPVTKQSSITGSLKKGDSTKRRFSVTLIAGDLDSLKKSSDSVVVSANEMGSVSDISGDIIPHKNSKATSDYFYSSREESEVCTNPNPRKSVGYIEALQKFAGLESVTARFFGFSGFALHSAQVWSNLVSYYVLHKESFQNVTKNISCACGADFCNSQLSCLEESVEAIDTDMRYLLTGISVILGVIAVIILLLFLDQLPNDKQQVTFSFRLILATFNHCRKNREQQFLIPISFYVGMLQGFYTADFTKSFVGCAWGTSHVGLVTIFYGLACATASTSAGMLVKYLGRIPLILLAQAVNLGVNSLLLIWTPNPEQPHLFYISAGMWGIVLGTFWALLPAFYGMIFKKDEEAAFGSYYLWSSLGWFVSFMYSDVICTSIKMYILVCVSTVGIIGYLITERMYYVKKNQIGLKYAG